MLGSAFVLLVAMLEPATERHDIVVTTTLRSDDGRLYCSLHDKPEAFPTKPAQARGKAAGEIHDGRAKCVFPNIEPGTYAIAIFHDENGNDTLDRSWIGIPTEGYGASNDARGRLGPPSFEDAKFRHGSKDTTMRIPVHY